MAGIYIHIPFCKRRCIYCDFYSVGSVLADWPRFVDALIAEADLRRKEFLSFSKSEPLSFYIGGGTPSLIPEENFKYLASSLIDLIGKPAEFTIEVNPDDINSQKAEAWANVGVNRVSMGVQSLNDDELSFIGRRHSSAHVRSALSILKEKFSNISLDLMFGLPGQTLDSLSKTISEIVDMQPQHISVYSLMYEERSALTKLRDMGRIGEMAEDESLEMFKLISSVLKENGFERYEISNYSKPGFRSLHNSSYWAGVPYLGLGPAAHSYDGKNTRKANIADFKTYLAEIEKNNTAYIVEKLSDEELREEMIMTRLRTAEGLSLSHFRSRFGTNEENSLMSKAYTWIKTGHLALSANAELSLTDKGVMVSDEIISDLF
ncbi:MAG: radical SAM family heme chaperone HemW [Bacteroides sp.]|nr:radical SAM family heme chaperone HemW [Bacteroides sp.]